LIDLGIDEGTISSVFNQLGKYDINKIETILSVDDSELVSIINDLEQNVVEIPFRLVEVDDGDNIGAGDNRRNRTKKQKRKHRQRRRASAAA